MRAMVLKQFKSDLVLENVDLPKLGPHEVLIKVKACGMCRTDIKIKNGLMDPRIIKLPHIMGHEIAGIVEEIGENVVNIKTGQRVVVYFYETCQSCRYCLEGKENLCSDIKRPGFEYDGGFAEYVKIPENNVVLIEDGISFEEAAVVPDAVATNYHALVKQSNMQPGETVLIAGVGGLGVHAIQIVKALGGRVIACDIDDKRLDTALKYGADAALSAMGNDLESKIKDLTGGYGADICLDLVGTPLGFNLFLKSTRKGGRYCLVGYSPNHPLTIDTVSYHLNEYQLIGCRASTKQDLIDVLGLMKKGLIKSVIDEVYPLEDVNIGLANLEQGKILGRGIVKF